MSVATWKALKVKVDENDLQDEADRTQLGKALDLLIALHELLFQKRPSTVTARKLLENGAPKTKEQAPEKPDPPRKPPLLDPEDQTKKKKEDHKKSTKKKHNKNKGRLPNSAYPKAARIDVPHPCVQDGTSCLCGGTFRQRAELEGHLRIFGQPPLIAKRYVPASYRCNHCQKVETAPLPAEAGPTRFHPSAHAIITLLQQEFGVTGYRLEQFQKIHGIPIPDSTQWDRQEEMANALFPIFQHLEQLAADAPLFYMDDTGVKILSQMAENKTLKDSDRKGTHLTAVIADDPAHPIILYYAGRNHAGENLGNLLKKRDPTLPKPLQMSDALAANTAHDHETVPLNCLAHAVRRFKELQSSQPHFCGEILRAFEHIYTNDHHTKQAHMDAEARLDYHRRHSRSWVDRLHVYLRRLLDEKFVAPNGALGEAITYMLKRWQRFNGFLEIPGAPLDNNAVERVIKAFVRYRKNSLFYHNEVSAWINTLLLSLIQTTKACRTNPFDYLTAVLTHEVDVSAHPARWLPWCWSERAAELTTQAAVAQSAPENQSGANPPPTLFVAGHRSISESKVPARGAG